jgi:2-acylglycerol O-acyltransferase 2
VIRTLSTPNKSLVLVPGGAHEALYAHPNSFMLHLKERKGFVQCAITTGASLVPILGFGENELFETVDNTDTTSILFKLQVFVLKKFSFSIPIPTHILPRKKPLTVVVGSPIDCSKIKCDDPSSSLINKIHAEYVQALTSLYEKNTEKYGQNIPLVIA